MKTNKDMHNPTTRLRGGKTVTMRGAWCNNGAYRKHMRSLWEASDRMKSLCDKTLAMIDRGLENEDCPICGSPVKAGRCSQPGRHYN